MQHELAILSRFIEQAFECSVFRYEGNNEELRSHIAHHCFLEHVQPALRFEKMLDIFEKISSNTLYDIKDHLGIHFNLFQLQGCRFLVGPWVEESWNAEQAENRLAKAHLSMAYMNPYQLYYSRYRVLEPIQVQKIIFAAVSAVLPQTPAFLYQSLTAPPNKAETDIAEEKPINFDAVLKGYQKENQFIKMISEGRSEAALKAYRALEHNSFSFREGDAFYQGHIRQFIASATIVRTLARKAAERGGVHPAIVDAISKSYAQKMYAASSREEVEEFIPALIAEFSQAVQTAQVEKYSLPVKRVADYIKLNISQAMTLPQLAKIAVVSSNYLSVIFKKETGVTVSQYIAIQRCKKAAELLHQTNLSIQEISQYVGYLDNNYFVKVFKEQYHCTPSSYRRKKYEIIK